MFVSNVLSGTVTRLKLNIPAHGTNIQITSAVQIASGYTHRGDPAAFEVGPTGLALDTRTDPLYVASTADNTIYAIPHASSRTGPVNRGAVAFADPHLRGPLALRFAPNGNLLTANGDAVNADVLHPSEIVEFSVGGEFVREYNVDSSQGGAFGIDTVIGDADRGGDDDNRTAAGFNYAVIDDVTNSLAVLKVPER